MIIIIILLILCLPLILMLSLFTTTSMISMAVDVPVSGIEVVEEEMIELDYDIGQTLTVDYVISPVEATNKNIVFIFEPVGSQKLATFRVEGNTLIPTSAGWAKVTVATVDGDFRDSFIVYVKSKAVTAIVSKPERAEISVGETTMIVTEFEPKIATNRSLSYRVVEGEEFITVDATGKIRGIGIGKATVEVTSLDNPEAKSTFEINVISSGVLDFSSTGNSHTILSSPNGQFNAVINPAVNVDGEPIIEVLFEDCTSADSVLEYTYDSANGVVSYTILDRSFIGRVEIRMTVNTTNAGSETKSFFVTQVSEVSAEWTPDEWNASYGSILMLEWSAKNVGIDLNPLGADVSFVADIEYITTSGTETTLQLALVEGMSYNLEGGTISLKIVNSTEGTYLQIDRTEQISGAKTSIKLTVIDNNNESSKVELPELIVELL